MGSTRDNLRRRVRKTVKWGGLVLTVVLLVVWIGSSKVTAIWTGANGLGGGLAAGVLGMAQTSSGTPDGRAPGFHVDFEDNGLMWWFYRSSGGTGWEFDIPLWCPALLSLLATAAAWRADAKYLRRVRGGACPACGYDRAGLAAGSLCPECGAGAGVRNPPASV